MMKGISSKWPAATALSVVAFFIVAQSAHAYAIPSGPQGPQTSFDFSQSFENLLTPFSNFVNSMEGAGQSVAPIALPSVSPIKATTSVAFQGFDDWVYAHAGFRPSAVLYLFLSIFSWILGTLKKVVDWLLSLF